MSSFINIPGGYVTPNGNVVMHNGSHGVITPNNNVVIISGQPQTKPQPPRISNILNQPPRISNILKKLK